MDVIHLLHPQHLVFCFECIRYTFLFGKLFYQTREHFLCLLVYVGKVIVQLASYQKSGIEMSFVPADIPQMPLSLYADRSALRLVLSCNQIIVPDKLITQACPFVCNEFLHCVVLQIEIFTSKSIPLPLNSVF